MQPDTIHADTQGKARVSKIESQLIWVSDFQMLYLGEALKVLPLELPPSSILPSGWAKTSQAAREKSDRAGAG